MQLVCHDTGDSSGYIEGSWMFRAQAFFFKSLSIQTKPQNYLCAGQRSDSPWESPAIFEAAVIIYLSAEGSWIRWLWHNVHREAVGQQELAQAGVELNLRASLLPAAQAQPSKGASLASAA